MKAVKRLGCGLPSIFLGQLRAAKSVIVIEDAGYFIDVLDNCYGYSYRFPFKGTWSMCIDSALLQILPIALIHLQVGGGKNYTKLQSTADYNFRRSFILKCLEKHPLRESSDCGYYRLFIFGDGRPLLITEAHTDGTHFKRRYWNYDHWSVYAC